MSEPQPYNFAKPGRLTAEVGQRVSGWLRGGAALALKKASQHLPFPLEMSFVGLEVQRPADGLAKLPETAVGYGVSINNSALNGMAVLPRPLALALVGALLGEPGSALPEDRELTVVEHDLGEFFVGEVLIAPLQETWPAAESIPIHLRRREPVPRWTRIFPPDDNIVICTFSVKGPFGESEWYWLLSQKHLLEQLVRSIPGGEKVKATSGPADAVRLQFLVEELPAELTVLLGTVELSLAELAKLSVGDVVILNQRVSEPLAAYLAGEKKVRGWPGRVGSRQAFEIESFGEANAMATEQREVTDQGAGSDVVARVAQFAELTGNAGEPAAGGLEGLQDVTVTVSAELGRVTLSIGEVLKLGVGSVLELHRSISEPVDLMVQGVRLARGEVVVVDDRFAIRIREIADPKKRT